MILGQRLIKNPLHLGNKHSFTPHYLGNRQYFMPKAPTSLLANHNTHVHKSVLEK